MRGILVGPRYSLRAHQIAISPKGEKRQAKMGAKRERHKYS